MIKDNQSMVMNSDQLSQLQELLTTAQNIIIIVKAEEQFDYFASAMALSLALQSAQKQVDLFSVNQNNPNWSFLAGVDQIRKQLGKQNLVISFDYNEQAVDKVSYYIGEESKKFYLTIKPQKGCQPLAENSVHFSYSGAEADLIILINIEDLKSLDNLYHGYESLYQDAALVTINNFDSQLGSLNLNLADNFCLSEGIFLLIQNLGLTVPAAAASNFLAGIEVASNRFTSLSMTGQTFEIIAQLISLGAVRISQQNWSLLQLKIQQGQRDLKSVPPHHQELRQPPKNQEISIKKSDLAAKNKQSYKINYPQKKRFKIINKNVKEADRSNKNNFLPPETKNFQR